MVESSFIAELPVVMLTAIIAAQNLEAVANVKWMAFQNGDSRQVIITNSVKAMWSLEFLLLVNDWAQRVIQNLKFIQGKFMRTVQFCYLAKETGSDQRNFKLSNFINPPFHMIKILLVDALIAIDTKPQ